MGSQQVRRVCASLKSITLSVIVSVSGDLGRVRIFRNKPFTRFARKVRITDAELCEAVSNVERGLIDADLGGGVIKQRIARKGAGKSGGFRALILLRAGERAFFVHGFAKSDRDNIRNDELAALRKLAGELLNYEEAALANALAAGVLMEVTCDEQEQTIS